LREEACSWQRLAEKTTTVSDFAQARTCVQPGRPLHHNTPTPPLNGHHRQNTNSSDSCVSWPGNAFAVSLYLIQRLERLQILEKLMHENTHSRASGLRRKIEPANPPGRNAPSPWINACQNFFAR